MIEGVMKTDQEDDNPEPKARGLEEEDSDEWITKIRELMAKTKV